MNNKKFKIIDLIIMIFFLLFFYSVQNIFLPIQKYYMYNKLSYLNIFLEILKFIIINILLLKIKNRRLRDLLIFISMFFYYSGINFFMIYLSWLFQNRDKNKKNILYLMLLIISFYFYYFYIEYLISINKEYLIHIFLIIKLLIIIFSIAYLSTIEDISQTLKEIINNPIFNTFLIAIIVKNSINFTPLFIDYSEYKWIYINNMLFSSILTIFVSSIFFFLNISIFDKNIKLYPFIIISLFLNISLNLDILYYNDYIPKEIIFIAYIFLILYAINLIINFRKNKFQIEYIYKYRLILIIFYFLNTFIYIGIYKYDEYNYINIFFNMDFIQQIVFIALIGH